MHLPNKSVSRVHHRILVIAAIQEHAAGKDQQARQQQQQHFQTLLAAIDEVSVEHVGILRRRKSILRVSALFMVSKLEAV